jgi:hypothetical protein
MRRPEPVAASFRCSLCGLDWSKHSKDTTIEECVELLKQELVNARKPREFSTLKEVKEVG